MKLKIKRFDHVYPPQTDTFLLLKHIRPSAEDVVLELGTGCGVIALHLAQTAKRVVAVDFNPHAVKNARYNVAINRIHNIDIHQGDLYEPVTSRRFDLVVSNPPYVPTPPNWQETDIIEKSWNAGTNGRKLIDRIIAGLAKHLTPDGRFVFVQSSLADIAQTEKQLQAKGFSTRVIARKWMPFGPICRGRLDWLSQQATFTSEAERLVVIEARVA